MGDAAPPPRSSAAGADDTAAVASSRGGALPGRLEIVGHDPLLNRGMNAALAVHGSHVYVGSRSDGSHDHGGVLIVDVADPADPLAVGEIGPPHAGNPGETSRELRVWHNQNVLVTLNFACDPYLHVCRAQRVPTTFRFFDVSGDHARQPRLLASFEPPRSSHEFFLWADPANPARALLYVSVVPGIVVLDISQVRDGQVTQVASWDVPEQRGEVHSVSVSADGRRAYVAALSDGVLVLDTGALAEGVADPVLREVTSPETRPSWEGPGAHSAIPVPGTGHVLTTDEVYGTAAGGPAGLGCPWGWVRIIDARDERAPHPVSEYKVEPWNGGCPTEPTDAEFERDRFASFSSHNPTTTDRVALVSWHAAGLQVIDIDDPGAPRQLAEFLQEPLATVATEDPGLTAGIEKVAMWSYPVISDGLIYVVDIRNGLYVLRYHGPHDDDIGGTDFLEGNSNL